MKALTAQSKIEIKQVLESIIGWFVQHPAPIHLIEGTNCSIVEIHPHPDDIGALIGRRGCIANSLRLLISAYGNRLTHDLYLQIVECGEKPRRRRREED